MWRLGAALAADGKDADALNSYIESYKTDKPDFAKYAVVETLYKKVNGSTDGLEEKIGRERVAVIQTMPEPAAPAPTPVVATVTEVSQPVSTDKPAATNSKPETSGDVVAAPTENAPVVEKEKTATGTSAPPASTNIETRSQPVEKEISNPPVVESKPVDTPAEKIKENPAPPVVEPKAQAGAGESGKSGQVDTPPVQPPSRPTTDETEKAKETAPPLKDPKPETSEPEKPVEKPPDQITRAVRSTERSGRTQKPAAQGSAAVAKPLFEPIIITIPDSRPRVVPTTEETSKETSGKTAEAEKPSADTTGATRMTEEVKVDSPVCSIGFSQESVSVINDGGKVGILVNVDGPGDIKKLTARSSSPKDIEVTMEPEISGMPERRFFVIRSRSDSLGVYQVTFAMPCGKKDLIVNVR